MKKVLGASTYHEITSITVLMCNTKTVHGGTFVGNGKY